MRIKNVCFLLVCAAFLLGSCKKSASTASATITTTINGASETFNTGAFAEISNNSWASTLVIGGYENNNAHPDLIAIQVSGLGYITTGTYTFAKANFNTPQPDIFYSQNSNTAYSQDSTGTNTITITALSSSSVQGTFSGTLLLDSASAPTTVTKIAISGSFNVPVRKP